MRYLLRSVRAYLFLFLLLASVVIYAVYQQVLYVNKQRRDFFFNYTEDNTENEKELLKIKQVHVRNIYAYKKQIQWYNKRQIVLNSIMGPVNNSTFVIVIQCHSNRYHLEQLIYSLRKAFLIDTALLIFSHDHYSTRINKVIQTINFAKYMQIFYPYSMQLHPNVFPGPEPKSCVDDFHCMKTKDRDPVAAQSKNHWWWQANQIFDHLKVLQNYNGHILFLEEDNYVTKDVLVIFRLLVYARDLHCPSCKMISLAAHNPEISQYKKRKSIVTVETWTANMSRIGIAFNKKTWNAIKSSKEAFCFYNDSNWDSSLKHLWAEKWDGNIYIIAINGPRVFQLGKCDDKDTDCTIQYQVNKVKHFIHLISKQFYPFSIKIKFISNEDFNLTASGFWNDVRDHELCVHFAEQSVWY